MESIRNKNFMICGLKVLRCCTKSHDFVRSLSGVMQINTYLISKRPSYISGSIWAKFASAFTHLTADSQVSDLLNGRILFLNPTFPPWYSVKFQINYAYNCTVISKLMYQSTGMCAVCQYLISLNHWTSLSSLYQTQNTNKQHKKQSLLELTYSDSLVQHQ